MGPDRHRRVPSDFERAVELPEAFAGVGQIGQASGRGGRDGLPSRAAILRGGSDFIDEIVDQYIDVEEPHGRRIRVTIPIDI